MTTMISLNNDRRHGKLSFTYLAILNIDSIIEKMPQRVSALILHEKFKIEQKDYFLIKCSIFKDESKLQLENEKVLCLGSTIMKWIVKSKSNLIVNCIPISIE